MKKLSDFALPITEEEYRADEALSYSLLSRYMREGFDNLEHLKDEVHSPSITFGSAVDAIITGGEQEFQKKFIVADIPAVTDVVKQMCFAVLAGMPYMKNNGTTLVANDLDTVTDNDINNFTGDIQYYNNLKPETRAKKIREACSAYYRVMASAGDREILDKDTYIDVKNVVEALRTAPATKFYFEPNNAFDSNIERFYQLKFKAPIGNIEYKIMPDELIVVHDKKLIVPVDLKTSSLPEYKFPEAFIKWHYWIQAMLYTEVIAEVLRNDEYFKEFSIAKYKFIVCNKRTLTPLVWEFNQFECPNIEDYKPVSSIGIELYNYLKEMPKVPNGIDLVKSNSIDKWIIQNESTKTRQQS